MKRIAHNYRRFSSGKQATGSSLDRQEDAADAIISKHGWQLGEVFVDAGVSSFRGKNAVDGELSEFLAKVKSGAVRSGEILVIERIDRLGRDEIWPALTVISNILKAGVDLCTVEPERIYTADDLNSMPTMIELVVNQFLANEESRKKRGWSLGGWKKRIKNARDGIATPGACPHWLEWDEEAKEYKRNEHASSIEWMFAACGEGMGYGVIAKKLNAMRKPTPTTLKRAHALKMGNKLKNPESTKGQFWTAGMVRGLLKSRTVLGEMEFSIDSKSAGWLKVYPAILNESLYLKAHSEINARNRTQGRTSRKTGNLFSGLITYDCGKMTTINKGNKVYLISTAGLAGVKQYAAFPYQVFEDRFLKELKELKFPTENDGETPDQKLNQLTTKLNSIEDNRVKLLAYLAERDLDDKSGSFLDLLTKYDVQKLEVEKEIETLKREAMRSTLEDLGREISSGEKEHRKKLKVLLRGLIKDIVIMELKEEYEEAGFQWEKIDGKYYINGGSAQKWCKANGRIFTSLLYRHEQGLPMGEKIKKLKCNCHFRNGFTRDFEIWSNGYSKSSLWLPAKYVAEAWHMQENSEED